MVNINLELYDFLKEVETSLFVNPPNFINQRNEVIAIAFIDFDDLSKFTEIVGHDYFVDDGGMDVTLQGDCICIELNDIFAYEGNTIADYKRCFDEDDFNEYERYMV